MELTRWMQWPVKCDRINGLFNLYDFIWMNYQLLNVKIILRNGLAPFQTWYI